MAEPAASAAMLPTHHGLFFYLLILTSEAHQDAVGYDEDGEGDGEAAVAGCVQGRHCRAEDDQFDPQPYERHGHRGAGRREQPPENRRDKRCTDPQRRLGDRPAASPHAPVTQRD